MNKNDPIQKKYQQTLDRVERLKEELLRQHQKRFTEEPPQKISLLNHLPKNSFYKQYVSHIAELCWLPESTTFLIGLGIFSSIASRSYHVRFADGDMLPIGLYTVAEHPPGTGKSRCMGIFSGPFYEFYKASASTNEKPVLFVSSCTPEGLEKTLDGTLGHFSAVSAEQGLIDTLFGGMYKAVGAKNNNELVLKGFTGEWVSSQRVTRAGFTGRVTGGISVFAQNGTVETILQSSNGTGLADRFLMLSEPDMLGIRDHKRKFERDESLDDKYQEICYKVAQIGLISPASFEETKSLTFSDNAYELIAEFSNKLEPLLKSGEQFGSNYLRGACGKAPIQVMKIAANLSLLNGGSKLDVVWDDFVIQAINIFNDLLVASYHMAVKKEVIGTEAQEAAIIAYLDKKGRRSKTEIQHACRYHNSFKELEHPKAEVGKVVDDMLARQVILRVGGTGASIYVA